MSKIIAEIGVNWNGDIDLAKQMITKSKSAGADYVKFQLFNVDVINNSMHKHLLSKMILGAEELYELRVQAYRDEIGFIVSCMYPESFELAESVAPDFIKIRHFDRNNDILAKLDIDYHKRTGTKVIVSSDVYTNIAEIYRMNPSMCYYMYCIPKYPPGFEDEISIINKRPYKRGIWSGLSSHFSNVLIPSLAVLDNTEFVEVHVSCFGYDIDRNVSLTFNQLKTLCDVNKGIYP